MGKQYAHTLASNVVLKFVIGLGIGVVTARALGPGGRGEYNLFVLTITLMTMLLNFGIPASNTYFIAKKRFSERQLFPASVLFALLLGLLSLLLLQILSWGGWLRFILSSDSLSGPATVALWILPVAFFNLFAQGILVGLQRIERNNYITLASQGALALLLLAAYALGMLTPGSAIALYAASQLVATVLFVRSSWPAEVTKQDRFLTANQYRVLLAFSGTVHLGNITQFFNYRLDAYIVNFFLGTSAVGQYSIATAIGETVWIVSATMASVLLPTLSASHEKGKEIAVKAAVATFGLSLLCGAGLAAVTPWLIPALFGAQFSEAVLPLLLLIPGVVIFSISNVLATYMTGAGRPGINSIIALVSFGFTMLFDILLIPRYGIAGASVASGISYAVTAALTVFMFIRVSGLRQDDMATILTTLPQDYRSAVARFLRKKGSISGR